MKLEAVADHGTLVQVAVNITYNAKTCTSIAFPKTKRKAAERAEITMALQLVKFVNEGYANGLIK